MIAVIVVGVCCYKKHAKKRQDEGTIPIQPDSSNSNNYIKAPHEVMYEANRLSEDPQFIPVGQNYEYLKKGDQVPFKPIGKNKEYSEPNSSSNSKNKLQSEPISKKSSSDAINDPNRPMHLIG